MLCILIVLVSHISWDQEWGKATTQHRPAGSAASSYSFWTKQSLYWDSGTSGSINSSIMGQRSSWIHMEPRGASAWGCRVLSALHLPWSQRHGAPEVKGGDKEASNHTLQTLGNSGGYRKTHRYIVVQDEFKCPWGAAPSVTSDLPVDSSMHRDE